jgi:hypothetical protein
LGNELTNLKKQQAQARLPPPQATYTPPSFRPPYQAPYPAYNNNRYNNANAPITTNPNPVRVIVPQNNMAQEPSFCPNGDYEHCVCQGVESSYALTAQDQVAGQPQNADGSHCQQGEHSFMNHQVDEHCRAIYENTRSKRRAIDDVSSTPANQASTSTAAPHAPVSSVPNRAAE